MRDSDFSVVGKLGDSLGRDIPIVGRTRETWATHRLCTGSIELGCQGEPVEGHCLVSLQRLGV